MFITLCQPETGQTAKTIRSLIRQARKERRVPAILSIGRDQFDDLFAESLRTIGPYGEDIDQDAAFRALLAQPLGSSRFYGVVVRWSFGNVLSLTCRDR